MQDSLTSSTRNECARLVGRLTPQELEIISQHYIKAFKMTSLEHVRCNFSTEITTDHHNFLILILIFAKPPTYTN